MKILYALNSGDPGGVEKYVLELTKEFTKRGNDIFVVCKTGIISEWYKNSGAKVFFQNINFEIDPFYIINLVKIIRDNNIELVHTNELKCGINALIAAKIAGKAKIVTHVHTPISEWQTRGFLKKIYTKIEIFLYSQIVNNFSDTEIALTESRKKTKIKEGIKAEKMQVISNGIDSDSLLFTDNEKNNLRNSFKLRYALPSNSYIFGNVGRHSIEKGHIYLIRAFANLTKQIDSKNIFLVLAGGGELTDYLKSEAQNLNIDKQIIFTGKFEQIKIKEIYASFDCFVFPSIAEGFGLVLAEAMLQKIPVISSDLEVLKEVGGQNVIYFESRNIEELKNKMLLVLNFSESEKSDQIYKNYQRVIENFSLEMFVSNYQKLYQSLLNSK